MTHDIPCSSGTELLSGQKSYLLDSSELRPLSPRDGCFGMYSRRNSGSHADASTSRGKTALSCDERLTFKLSSHLNSEPGCHTENKGLEFSRPDRVRFSSLVMDAVSSDALRIVCGICQKLVRRRPYFIGNALTAGEFSVVAILVCGHIYHSECLEQKTSLEDMRDPPCPLCAGLLSEEVATREQE
ncbi:hypothetical protein OIU74_025662 [Salix koriyanagi]|uniref:RING-type domain-containing protein n=1 Tax=Salix koriyanagi TaxID=2511006 RepID=A0A9Q0W1R0_9ROSI|nr:hypothetical protein OIU74_025662 [Salix koriyanagi]